jgi:hypothetical protein
MSTKNKAEDVAAEIDRYILQLKRRGAFDPKKLAATLESATRILRQLSGEH